MHTAYAREQRLKDSRGSRDWEERVPKPAMRQDAATTGSCTTKILSLPITPISAAAIASLLRRRGADAMGMAGRKGMGIACDFSLSVVVNRCDPWLFGSPFPSAGVQPKIPERTVGRPMISRSHHLWPNGPVPSASQRQRLGNRMR